MTLVFMIMTLVSSLARIVMIINVSSVIIIIVFNSFIKMMHHGVKSFNI